MPNQTVAINMEANATWLLEEGDYIEFVAYHDLGVTLDIRDQVFSVVRVP